MDGLPVARRPGEVRVREIAAKSALNRVRGMGFTWSLNPFTGCAHQCVFCYARGTHAYRELDGVRQWGSELTVKVNVAAVLRADLAGRAYRGEEIAIGTATDPYQALEGRYRLMRGILTALRDARAPFHITTRSPLIVRDLDLVAQCARRADAGVAVSIATLDEALAREIEPTVAPPRQRLRAVRALAEAGVRVGVAVAPVLPGLTDDPEALAEVVHAGARRRGARLAQRAESGRDHARRVLRVSGRHTARAGRALPAPVPARALRRAGLRARGVRARARRLPHGALRATACASARSCGRAARADLGPRAGRAEQRAMRTRAWRFAPVLIVASLLSFGIPAPAADGVPDADTIHAKIAAASGAFPGTFRETAETVTSSGSTTVEHRFRRGKDFRTTNDTGRFHTERGSLNGQAWHMNDNGQVVLEQPDPGRAARERIATTVTPIAAPVAGYMISALNAQGYGAKEYVDAAAWRVVRRDVIGVNGTVTTTYDDVRPDHGRVFAHHAHIDNGYSQISGDMRIVEYVPGEFPASEIAIPRPRRALVTFPPGVTSVELPAKFGRSHVYVRINVGGRGLDFVLDSGAAGITIDSTVARELGLPEYDKRSTVTAGRFTTARTVIPEMRIGPLVMRDVAVQEVPHGWQTAPDVKEVGLLGFDFLSELGVTIDYEHERVTVVPSAAYVPPTDPHTIPVDVRVGSGQPRATVSVNGAVGERWILDTGGAGTFLIFDYFARRYPEALRDVGGGDQRDRHLFGIGGAIAAKPYQIASLQLANMNFTDWVGYRVDGRGAYAQNDDGVVGVEFLRLFTVGFDYANGRVYLVPNRDGRIAMGLPE